MSAVEGASELAVQTNERVAQYYSLYSWLLSTIVHESFIAVEQEFEMKFPIGLFFPLFLLLALSIPVSFLFYICFNGLEKAIERFQSTF